MSGAMSDSQKPQGSQPEKGSDAPSLGDGIALGIGCLVTLILLGAAAFFGYVRN
jgi:hypothetical protein